jgi:hypothetical protein
VHAQPVVVKLIVFENIFSFKVEQDQAFALWLSEALKIENCKFTQL